MSFVENEKATDVVHMTDADGYSVVSNNVVGGDYMVVELEFLSDDSGKAKPCTFDLQVNGFGFEIGKHDRSFGMTRKLTAPVVSMIPCPAKKEAQCTAATVRSFLYCFSRGDQKKNFFVAFL